MEWMADVAAGDWILEGIDAPWRGTIHDVIPRGFTAYARVLHPPTRERPVDGSWPADDDLAGWERFLARAPLVDTEDVTWAQTAAAFGTRIHPLAQWQRLVRSDSPYAEGAARDSEGWRYDDPPQGQLDAQSWTLLASVLARHTSTPGEGAVAVWEGWGGLTGGVRYGASRVLLEKDAAPSHAAFLAHAARDVFNDVFRKPTWQPGILSDEISRGPRLELPGRTFVLFAGGVAELSAPDWPDRMPWADPYRGDSGIAPAESPGVVWPADHAWITVSEVDFDSTIVGGDTALIDALLATPGLEVQALPHDADLSWDGDVQNRDAPNRDAPA